MCSVFDIDSQKWRKLPLLNEKRKFCGSFVSQNKDFLYVFGSENKSIERISLKKEKFQDWEIVPSRFPIQIRFKSGFVMIN